MIMNPSAIKNVVLDGHSLTLESFVAVARYGATVELADSAMEAMKKSRALAEKIADEGRVAYGITTGFGDFQRVAVSSEMSNQLSTNLILSHCTATGEPYAEEVVRGMMLLRANALCVGVSGVRPLLVEMLIEMLNKGVHPVVPQKGSLGSSGDLAPLAHMSLPLLGKGEAVYQGVKMSGAEAMESAARRASPWWPRTCASCWRAPRFWTTARTTACRTPTPCAASPSSTALCVTPWTMCATR